MEYIYGLLVLIAVGGIVGIIHVVNYNRLHRKKIRMDEAEFSIDETLRYRYDLIVRVSNIIKSNVDMNVDYFKDFESLKTKKISNFELDRKTSEAINLVFQLIEDYPKLEENRGMQDVLKELKDSEENLEAAKSFYNKYTSQLNTIIRSFPSNIVAKIHHFSPRAFFDGKDLEDQIIKDMKL